MTDGSPASLETALARTESDADAALKAAGVVTKALKKLHAAAHTGDLRELRRIMETADQAITALRQQFVNLQEGWDFDEDQYFAGAAFTEELLTAATAAGVKIHEHDGRLYSFPFLLRVLPADRAVQIDKKRERRIRPGVFVAHLKDLQERPVRARHEPFLEALFNAYEVAVQGRGEELLKTKTVIQLARIYELLTLLPGQSKEYPREEFARDIYLLDESGVRVTKGGMKLSFHAATGTKASHLTVVAKTGALKKYYGLAFTAEG